MSFVTDTGLDKLNYNLIAYVFSVCVIMFYMIRYLQASGRGLALAVTSILFLLIFIFFGIRWFKYGVQGDPTPKSGPWPPVINVCPDYFTLVNGQCADLVGVLLTGNAQGLKTWTIDDSPTKTPIGTAGKYFPYTCTKGNCPSGSISSYTTGTIPTITWEGIFPNPQTMPDGSTPPVQGPATCTPA
jgi:hypothetical protein